MKSTNVLSAAAVEAAAFMMEAASTSETSVDFHQTTRQNMSKDIFKHH
jgi:hypothetical protein